MSKIIKILYTWWTFLSGWTERDRVVTWKYSFKNIKKTEELIKNLWYSIDSESIYNIDSSDLDLNHRRQLREKILEIEKKDKDHYLWYIVIHGTDTMEYSASMLSYLLREVKKSIVLTWSMHSIDFLYSDAPNNLIWSLKTIETFAENKWWVFVVFWDKVLQWNKSNKIKTNQFDAFDSPGYDNIWTLIWSLENKELVVNQERLNIYQEALWNQQNMPSFSREWMLDPNIDFYKIYPGFNPDLFENSIISGKKWIILEWYWDWNFPMSEIFLKKIEKILKKWIVVVLKSQCNNGICEYKYEWARKIMNLDNGFLIPLQHITTSAAITKLMWTLWAAPEITQVKEIMTKNIVWELL